MPFNHLSGKGCPKCRQSHLEEEVMIELEKRKIEYIPQWHLPWSKYYSLDFYLPNHKIGIECQGIQHFEEGHFGNNNELNEIIKRDKYKYNSCFENGIKVLYYSNIPNESCFNDINKLFEEIL